MRAAGAAFALRLAATALAILAVADAAVVVAFPIQPRLPESFSAAYLARELRGLRGSAPTVVFGDSALWGYGVSPAEAAVTRLWPQRRAWVNLSYEGGSAANSYAMLRVLQAARVTPRAVVFNVNLKEFNAEDSAYQKLYPAVERLAWNALGAEERARLTAVTPRDGEARLARTVEAVWQVYGMRSDLRETVFGRPDAASALLALVERFSGAAARRAAAHRATPESFEGAYDLSPLDDANVEVYFLRRLARTLRDERVTAYALLTPTNHRLLHAYIDVPEYREQLAYVSAVLRRYGVRVLDYDRALPSGDFIDNDHLTAAGNAALAGLLARDVRP